jgi:hypothetical protein
LWLSTWGRPEQQLSWMAFLPSRSNFTHCCHCVIRQSSITTCFSQSLMIALCTTMSYNFNFYPGALYLFHKHVVRVLELGSCTSRWCTVQLRHSQSTHCTSSTELVPSVTDGASATWCTSFMLQQYYHYFLYNPCILHYKEISCHVNRLLEPGIKRFMF